MNRNHEKANSAYGGGMAAGYDALMGCDYSYAAYANYITAFFGKYGVPENALVADLGCGTGSLCAELALRGYDMIGIDNSAEMLSAARAKTAARDILFLQQELYDFELYGTVAAFVSTIDSLNYITDKRRLARVFKLVDNYLDPGGLFIFDLNTPYRLESVFGSNHFYYVSDDFCYLWQSAYSRGIAAFDLTFFERAENGLWKRDDEFHRQRAYDDSDIRRAADGTALARQGRYAFLGTKPPGRNAEKVSYIYQKSRYGI